MNDKMEWGNAIAAALLFVIFAIPVVGDAPGTGIDQCETEYCYLPGTGKDDAVEWDFFCMGGRKSGEWSKIPVPSQWELHGFGDYDYGMDKQHDETGKYRRMFSVLPQWKSKRIRIVFEGVMTDTEVLVNGRSAGPVHQGGFYRFGYDITNLVRAGENLLEVRFLGEVQVF